MGDTTWMEHFLPQHPGDKEWLDGMRCLFGSSEDDHKTDVCGAIAHFVKGVEMRNLLCVGEMAFCYEGLPGFPADLTKARDWRAKKWRWSVKNRIGWIGHMNE